LVIDYNHFCKANAIAGKKYKTFCQKTKNNLQGSPLVIRSKKAVTEITTKVKE
jgi:hypothetical protein